MRVRDDATTSELRHDWLADRWVIIAPQRTERPYDFVHRVDQAQDASGCPFCWGRENETPAAVATYAPKQNGVVRKWHVRVVPNKFPAVNGSIPGVSSETINHINRDVAQSDAADEDRIDLFQRRELLGGHEVIVESPLHLQSLSELDRETVGLVFKAYRDRLNHWLKDQELAYVVLFKNVGQDAGASLVHTHSQLIATNIVPTDVARGIERMRLFAQKESACLFCRMVEDELEQQLRVVEQTNDFVAFCPFASRVPALINVVPKQHHCGFGELSDAQIEQLSWLIHRLIRRVERCYPQAAYNFVIHTAPSTLCDTHIFHWRLELFPRLTKVAGFEWGSDCYINPLPPEQAAHSLRKVGV